MIDSVARFTGFAAEYDRARPRPPAELTRLLCAWAASPAPRVVDLGAGTGLSTAIWSGVAASVIALEPSPDMRALAERRLTTLPDAGSFTVLDALAEDTGLPAGAADLVVASQAMHWFDPARVLPEIARLLRPGGVFAAVDCDWPPVVRAEADAAYVEFERGLLTQDDTGGRRPAYADKEGHLGRLAASGLFGYTREICLHSVDSGDADRLVAVARSQGGTVAALAAGITEEALGLTALRETADRLLPEPVPWWWTYRVRLAVK
ncbi:MAG TPA: class I SAM-dependent methyltransferase [Pseudonocardiaceae bacterium]|jgi:SAM-dependent methyltransferase|nr:class I SAM-dependent methyltransferase [Pseudonocardiaceae bacterium]